jgi:hypothetical protein
MAKKKVKNIKLPPSKMDILTDEIFNHYMRARETGLYCIIDRTKGFHFFEVLKDGVWSYVGNGTDFDSILVIERLFLKDKCKLVKYPIYKASEEAIQLYKEFVEFSSKDLTKEELKGDAIDKKDVKIQEYIDKINTMPPSVEEVDQLAYTDGYNGELGYPVIPLEDIPVNIIKYISNKLAGYALSHFSTMSFLYDDNFTVAAQPIIVDPDSFNDLVVTFIIRAV